MKHLQLHNMVFNQPHMCTPELAESVLAVLSDRLNIEEGAFSTLGEAKQDKDEGIEEGVYTLPILGAMVHRGNSMDALCGTASYEAIQNKLQTALDNPEVKSILLDIDSGGGAVAGAFDLRDFILEAKEQKPIYALARDTMASAAYLIGSAATKVYASQTASVGSIGVVAMHVDQSKAIEEKGIKPTFIHAGAMKVAGNAYEPLEGEALSYLQENINESYEMLVEAVSEARGLDPQAIRDTEAKVFKGRKATTLGLVDGVRKMSTVKKELAKLNQTAGITPTISLKGQQMENENDVEALAGYTELKGTMATLTKAIEAEGFSVSEDGKLTKEEAPEMLEFDGEMVPKASIPTPVLKALEVTTAKNEEASLKAMAQEKFSGFSLDEGMTLAKVVSSLEGAEKATLESALATANESFEGLMEEKGEASVEGDLMDPEAKKAAMVKDYMSEHNVDIHKARSAVMETPEFKALKG